MERRVVLRLVFWAALALALAVGVFRFALWLAATTTGGESLRYAWEAMRHMALHGENPYDHLRLLYAWAAQDGVAFQPQVFPLHLAVAYFLPLTLFDDFVVVRALTMLGMWGAWVAAGVFFLRAFGWRGNRGLAVAVLLFGASWFFAAQAALASDVVGVVAALSLGVLAANMRGQDGAAGTLLALTLIKPDVGLPVAVFVLLWAASARRWRVWWAFWGVTVVLAGLAFWLLPSWPLDMVRLAVHFPAEFSVRALLAEAAPGIGRQVGWLLTGIVAFTVLAEWAAAWGKPASHAAWTLSLTLWGALWWGGRIAAVDQVVLAVPLVVVWLYWYRRWKTYGRLAVGLSLVALWLLSWFVGWPHSGFWAWASSSLAERLLLPALVWPLFYSVRWWAARDRVAWEELPLEV